MTNCRSITWHFLHYWLLLVMGKGSSKKQGKVWLGCRSSPAQLRRPRASSDQRDQLHVNDMRTAYMTQDGGGGSAIPVLEVHKLDPAQFWAEHVSQRRPVRHKQYHMILQIISLLHRPVRLCERARRAHPTCPPLLAGL